MTAHSLQRTSRTSSTSVEHTERNTALLTVGRNRQYRTLRKWPIPTRRREFPMELVLRRDTGTITAVQRPLRSEAGPAQRLLTPRSASPPLSFNAGGDVKVATCMVSFMWRSSSV